MGPVGCMSLAFLWGGGNYWSLVSRGVMGSVICFYRITMLRCEYTAVVAEKPIRRRRQNDGGEHLRDSHGGEILNMF